MTDWKDRPLSPNCVTIFGAGVAGLTAAHELVERGFRVQIWEKVGDPRYPHRGPDIGGMARTQWSRIGWDAQQSLDQPPQADKPFDAREATPIVPLLQKLVFLRRNDAGRWYVGEFKTPQKPAPEEPRTASIPPPALGASSQTAPSGPEELAKKNLLTRLGEANSAEENGPKRASYFIIRIRDYEAGGGAGGGKEQQSLVERALRGLRSVLGQDAVTHEPESQEIAVQVDKSEKRLMIRPAANGYFSANTYARIEYYTGRDFAPGDTYFALQREWTPGDLKALGKNGEQDSVKVLDEFVQALKEHPHIDYVYVETSDRDAQWLDAAERLKRAGIVHQGLTEELNKRDISFAGPHDTTSSSVSARPGGTAPLLYTVTVDRRKVIFEIVVLNEFPSDVPPQAHLYTSFRVREHWLPGEHGYRLFPNCYRHLFDTMKRTPILDTIPKTPFAMEQERAAGVRAPVAQRYVETGRSAFDNIRPTTSHLLAFENGAGPSVLSRSKLKSISELRELMHIIFAPVKTGAFEIAEGDAIRLSLKMLQYIISSPARRAQYENLSWWDFVDGDSYGARLGKFLEVWPEALVAMDARSADARSHGDSLIQVTLDQLRDGGFRDGTLRGPVSEAWFRPWRRYLEAQGVEFLHGEVTDFVVQQEEANGTRRVLPQVSCFEPRYPMDPQTGSPLLMPGYFVMAVSADQAAALSRNYLSAVARWKDLQAPPELSDFGKAAAFDDSDLDEARPESDFRHFAGLQFYFAEDVFWAEGHVYYPESPWGLSSVSQARFWDEKTDWEHGFRGILSVIVATWDRPGELVKKPAWECSPAELAIEVWHQIKRGVEKTRATSPTARRRAALPSERHRAERFHLDESLVNGQLPEPLHWRLDENLEWDLSTRRRTNRSPFHIARPGKYRSRPGSIEPRGYTVENAFVMCGMHMQTQFRLPTMEAANESARHAVNAILKHVHTAPAVRSTLCETWDPEMFEFDSMLVDLQSLKDLDHRLTERGLPHAMEILEADKWARKLVQEVGVWDVKTFVRLLVDMAGKVGSEVKNGY